MSVRITLRRILTIALVTFVAASVGWLAARWIRPAPSTRPAGPPRGHVVVAYWLHWPPSCIECEAIEAYSRETIRREFADAMAAGRLEWRAVNVEEPVYAHLREAFDLVTKSVVLAEYRDGKIVRWRLLDRTWKLVTDRPAFEAYVWDETRAFLDEVQP